MTLLKKQLVYVCMIALTTTLSGCGQKPDAAGKPNETSKTKKLDDHSEWWCSEHGVPEEVCGQCHEKLAAKFQKDGDWCKKHNRPDSQCFECHPEYAEKFAAQYEAKYGKKPPKSE